MINDDHIIKTFINQNGSINSAKIRKNSIKPEECKYLMNRFEYVESLSEAVHRIQHKIEIRPVCKICSAPVRYRKGTYTETCGNKQCVYENIRRNTLDRYGVKYVTQLDSHKEAVRSTNIRKYGGAAPICSEEVRSKIKDTCASNHGDSNYRNIEKRNKTCLDKYGTKNVLSSKEVRDTIKKTCQERYGGNSPASSKDVRLKMQATSFNRYGDPLYNNREQYKKTCLSLYGVENAFSSKDVQEKIALTNLERYGNKNIFGSNHGKQKIKETCQMKYGFEHWAASEELKERRRQTNIELHGDPNYNNRVKYKDTCVKRYGSENFFSSDYGKEKLRQTFIERYGAANPSSSKEVRDKAIRSFIERYGVDNPSKNETIQNKKYDTQRKNHTFNTSKPENQLYDMLCERFGIENIVRQYKSILYPFKCDFYIIEENTYIEYQGTWLHGGHEFNLNDENDINLINKIKSLDLESHPYYSRLIETWTKLDPMKRKTAKENNLNYIEFWNLKEAQDWIINYGDK